MAILMVASSSDLQRLRSSPFPNLQDEMFLDYAYNRNKREGWAEIFSTHPTQSWPGICLVHEEKVFGKAAETKEN